MLLNISDNSCNPHSQFGTSLSQVLACLSV
jgi:hypothetical protein